MRFKFLPMDEAWWCRPSSSSKRGGTRTLVEISHKTPHGWAIKLLTPLGVPIMKHVPESQLTEVNHEEPVWAQQLATS